jgi:hypothetical protein
MTMSPENYILDISGEIVIRETGVNGSRQVGGGCFLILLLSGCMIFFTPNERNFIELMTSDRKLEAFREGSK